MLQRRAIFDQSEIHRLAELAMANLRPAK
jgi:hypothetical protein